MTYTIAIAAVVGGAALFFWYRFRRWDLNRLECLEWSTNEFFENAAPLIDDDETPKEILSRLKALNSLLTMPRSPFVLLHVLSSGEMMQDETAEYERRQAVIDEFLNRRSELLPRFHRACAVSLFAISYKSRFLGPFIRIVLGAAGDGKRAGKVAQSVAKRGKHSSHDGFNHPDGAAGAPA